MIQLKQLIFGSWALMKYETLQSLGYKMLWLPTFVYNIKKIDQYNNEVLLISPRSKYIIRRQLGSRTLVLTESDSVGFSQDYIKLRIFEDLFEEEKWGFYDALY